MLILRGPLVEARYRTDSRQERLMGCKRIRMDTGATSYISDGIGVHAMENETSDYVVSLHIYSPPYKSAVIFSEETGRPLGESSLPVTAAQVPESAARMSSSSAAVEESLECKFVSVGTISPAGLDVGLLDWMCGHWQSTVLPALCDFVRVPNQSPLFDPDWQANGHLDRCVELVASWIAKQGLANSALEVLRVAGRTPLLVLDVGASDASLNSGPLSLVYCHVDKSPPMAEQWSPEHGPYMPHVRDGFLFGRGGADSGFAVFAAVSAIKALQLSGSSHGRICVVVDAGKKSNLDDLAHYIDGPLAPRLVRLGLVVALMSNCGDYKRLWLTSSLRGMANFDLTVAVLKQAVHSGYSGLVPSTFRIARALLSRLEDESTGRMIDDFHAAIPLARAAQASACAAVLGSAGLFADLPWVAGAGPLISANKAPDVHATDGLSAQARSECFEDESVVAELLLDRTWRPALSVTGAAGLPAADVAGNVLLPSTALRVSIRTPPTASAAGALQRATQLLTSDVPHGAHVAITNGHANSGWSAAIEPISLFECLSSASREFFDGHEAMFMGGLNSIPAANVFAERYPGVHFVVTGVLGPQSNSHGPNEALNIDYAIRLNCALAVILASVRQA